MEFATDVPTATTTGEPSENVIEVESRESRRKADWNRKCISNFSLYASLVTQAIADPSEDLSGFKQKLSKSTKKRLRRQRKKKVNKVLSVQSTKVQVVKRKTAKKEVKALMKKLSKL